MKYKLVSALNDEDIVLRINSFLSLGWKPQGGIFAISQNRSMKFYQAMVKGE